MGSQNCDEVGMPVPRRGLSLITTTVGPGQPTQRLECRCLSWCKLNLNLPVGDDFPHISAPASSFYPSDGLMYVDSSIDQSISQGMSLDNHIYNDNWLFSLSIASSSSNQCYDLNPLLPFFTLIFLLTQFSHDCVLVSHAYLLSDSVLSWPCTCISRSSSFRLISLTTMYFLSWLLHFDSWWPLSQKCIYRPRNSLYFPNLALLKYTWVPGLVHTLNLSPWYLKYPWDIPSSFIIVRDLTKSLVVIVLTVSSWDIVKYLIITSPLIHYKCSHVLHITLEPSITHSPWVVLPTVTPVPLR